VVEEVAEVDLAGLPVLADQGGGPRLLVEGLVPDLVYAVRRRPTLPDPRIRTVEEEQAGETPRVHPGKALRHVSAHVVADHPEPLEAKGVREGAKVLYQITKKPLRGVARFV
jgi:hypothetical protein